MEDKFIVVCSCPALFKQSQANYIEEFGESLPPIYKGRGPVSKLIESLQGLEAQNYVKAVSHTNRYAYYFEIDQLGNIKMVYNLAIKRRIF